MMTYCQESGVKGVCVGGLPLYSALNPFPPARGKFFLIPSPLEGEGEDGGESMVHPGDLKQGDQGWLSIS